MGCALAGFLSAEPTEQVVEIPVVGFGALVQTKTLVPETREDRIEGHAQEEEVLGMEPAHYSM